MVASWLTNAQGCVVYRGNAFPSNYLGSVFIADPTAHIIHRAVLREAGLAVGAVRPMDGTNTEFVASPDAAFRPVQLVNGPDGALYIADRRTPTIAGAFTASCRRTSSDPNPATRPGENIRSGRYALASERVAPRHGGAAAI